MISQFREFIMRGNIVDLAIAVVLGAAFGAVIASFVGDILAPLLGLVGLPDFKDAAVAVGNAQVRYGQFINALISFVAIATAIFLFVVKPMNALEARRQRGAEGDADHEDLHRVRVRDPLRRPSLRVLHPAPVLGAAR